MSNRSKKNIFFKEANDTLKRVFISPEYRNHMMEIVTGEKPKNGNVSLEWSKSNKDYLGVEDEYNNKLADSITSLRHEMAVVVKDLNKRHRSERAIERDKKIIPEDRFDEYLEQKRLVDDDIKQYIKVSHMYDGDERRVINDYTYSAISILQRVYGSPLPVKLYIIEDYRTLLKIYETHQKEYNLAYPSFPEEYLTKSLLT